MASGKKRGRGQRRRMGRRGVKWKWRRERKRRRKGGGRDDRKASMKGKEEEK